MSMISETSENITQGSIVDGVDFGFGENNPLGIVLSNACDFINDKMGFVLLASLIPAKNVILESKEFKNRVAGVGEDHKLSKTKWNSKIKPFLDDYIFNKGVSRYYFINMEPILESPPLFVDFQHVVSVPFAEINILENLAQLDSPYREQMMVQFASYTARIPIDRINDTSDLAKNLIEPEFMVVSN